MDIRVFETATEATLVAAKEIAAGVAQKPDTVLGLATGSTPLPLYAELIKMNEASEIDFKDVSMYSLDEYIGLPGDHLQSHRYYMNKNLINHINIDKANTHAPNGMNEEYEEESKAYDELIAADGGIDIQLLGIGHNGHIGFNEPDEVFFRGTHVADLATSTIYANKRFFARIQDVPEQAYTLGMGGIMGAKKIVLLAFGEGKAKAILDMVTGNIDPKCPASILQLHPNAIILLDKAAASLL